MASVLESGNPGGFVGTEEEDGVAHLSVKFLCEPLCPGLTHLVLYLRAVPFFCVDNPGRTVIVYKERAVDTLHTIGCEGYLADVVVHRMIGA